MKKTILTALAALLVAVPAVKAQKVNKEALLAKIEKSDADIANEKKAAKAATWLARGKAFYEVAVEPTKSIFANMEPTMLKLAVGEPKSTTKETLNGTEYDAWVYPYFTAYVKDNKVVTWKQSKWVLKDAPKKAIEAYNKAYELDPKTAEKVKEGLKQVSDFCSQVGNVGIDSGNYVEAADAYVTAFEAQSSPAYEKADPALLYYAGYLLTVDGSNNPKSFAKGGEYLTKAIDLGYADEEGNIYYYLFHCLYGQKDLDKGNIMKAKDVLLTGIGKFPKNERILDGLMQLYTAEQGVGDPADLIALVERGPLVRPRPYLLRAEGLRSEHRIVQEGRGAEARPVRGQLLPGCVLYDQGRRAQQGDEREAVQQPGGLRRRSESRQRCLQGCCALVREGAPDQTRRCRYAGVPQIHLLPSARRGRHHGEVQHLQCPLQAGERHRIAA